MTMKTREITRNIIRGFERLQRRQRMLVMMLAAAIAFSVYYNAVYKTQDAALGRARTERARAASELARIRGQMPDIDKEAEALNAAKRTLDNFKAELAGLEARLPTQGRVPRFLGELAHQASGYSIDFSSIRQKTSKERVEYPELNIEIKFNANYTDLVNYLNRVESISQFLKIADIRIEEMKDNFSGELSVTLILMTLIGDGASPITAAKEEGQTREFVPPIPVERNPFVSNIFAGTEKEKKLELRLNGIVARGKQSTAIINDDVYRVGDTVGNKVVKQIMPNMVVLSDGRESTVLTLSQ